jgi:glycosyltransferase involved in cell wall biosynthesis
VLFCSADAVLANSRHEPFGLVGLETMAVGGLACTGGTGEDYAIPDRNALVMETGEPGEFLTSFQKARKEPERERALRQAGRLTAERFSWANVLETELLPRLPFTLSDTDLRRSA